MKQRRARIPSGPGIESGGWLAGARRVVSPNADARPEGVAVALVVVHGISLPPGRFGGDAIERLFTNRLDAAAHPAFRDLAGLKVSAHFLVRRDGALLQFVGADARAWHAGASQWRGRERCNDFSIGVELEGADDCPYTRRQYDCLRSLVRRLAAHYPIEALAGHSDVAPGRKTDPGPAFDWRRLDGLAGRTGVLARPGREQRRRL